jgi:hypothetical protein
MTTPSGAHVTMGLLVIVCVQASVGAHAGPPYPIVSRQLAGPFIVSVWTDPDSTDDGSRGGQFWVIVDPANPGQAAPRDVRVAVSVRPLDRPGPAEQAAAAPIGGDGSRQFVALGMDHEGRFAVRVAVESSDGQAALDSEVQATYDVRPPRAMLALYVVPFLLVGFLWTRLLLKRRSRRSA